MNNSSFEEILEKEGRLIYTNVGNSMWPLIRVGRDLLVIEKKTGRLQKYDVPLYRRDSGQYVLHRVLRVRENDYVICGDNCWSREYGITDRQVLGVLTKIIRDGKELPLTGFRYQAYVHLWCDLFYLRAFLLKVRYVIKRIIKR